jgi:hypothetical protein
VKDWIYRIAKRGNQEGLCADSKSERVRETPSMTCKHFLQQIEYSETATAKRDAFARLGQGPMPLQERDDK